MTINEQTGFIEPSPHSIIWRYMSLPKFLNLLVTNELHFVRSTELDDPLEGMYTEKDLQSLETNSDIHKANALNIKKNLKKVMYVNCWHVNNFESAAMWKMYATEDNNGIAIRSTFKKLKMAVQANLDSTKDPLGPFFQKIRYVDYSKVDISDKRIFEHHLHKRKSFSHERELRAIIWKNFGYENQIGFGVPVDLKSLIYKIYLNPKGEKWVTDTLKILFNKLDIQFLSDRICQSNLFDDPYQSELK